MTYAISDIHGMYDKYIEMLKLIKFKNSDILYVLGDVVDRGPDSIKILQDMIKRSNVVPIIGNHDAMALDILGLLNAELIDYDIECYFGGDIREFYYYIDSWKAVGGEPVLTEFKALSFTEKNNVIEYLSTFSLYKTVALNNKSFIMTHSGVPQNAKPNNLHRYNLIDFLQAKVDYSEQYFGSDTFLITGHLPTHIINKASKGKIHRNNNHIVIDTGCGFKNGILSCICLDTSEEFYV